MSSASATSAEAAAPGPLQSDGGQGSLLSRARPLMLARSLSAGLSFAIPLVLARLLSPREYGTYKQLILVSQTLYYVLPFGVPQSLYYFVPRAQERRAYLGQAMGWVMGAGLVAACVLLVGGEAIARAVHNIDLAALRVPLALYTAGLIASYPLEVSLTAKGKTAQAAWAYVLSDVARTAAMTLPVMAGKGLFGLATALAVFALGRTAAAILVVQRGERGPLLDGRLLREQWRYALPFGAAIALAIPQQYFHQYVVSAAVDAAAFAVYSVGCFQLPVIDLLYTPTSEVLMVRIAELDAQGRLAEAAESFRDAAGKLALLFVPLAGFLFAAAPDFIPALFTGRYLASVHIFRIALWSIPLASLPVDGALRARNETRALFLCYAAKAAVTVPLVLAGVHWLGITGAILSWTVTEGLGKSLLLSRLPRALQSRLQSLLPLRPMGQAAASALAGALGVIAFRHLGPVASHAVRLLFEAGLFGALYGVGLFILGAQPHRLIAAAVRG